MVYEITGIGTTGHLKHHSTIHLPYLPRSPLEVYHPGTRLTLGLPAHNAALEVQIVKAFTPFTSSVVLLVKPESSAPRLPSRFILKVADRRLDSSWNLDRERDYQASIRSHVDTFGPTVIPREDEQLPFWMHLLQHWEYCERVHNQEREAYKRLSDAQELGLVPRFYGTAQLIMDQSACHPSLTHIQCLLIEYVQGRTMGSFRPGVNLSAEEAEVISQRVLQLGRDLRRYGVSHNDIHVDNVIIRSTDNCPVLIDWAHAYTRLADLPLQQRWTAHSMWLDFHCDIRYMLRHGNDGDEIVAGGVWHRYRTPISDIEQYRRRQDSSWELINHGISELSSEEKERFYDEDKSVDNNHGLRWKVKKGMRTRMVDDPVPIM